MTHRQRRPNARPAFTMIELLVVITIIAILVALLTGAVMRGLGKGAEVTCSSEIGELQSKLSAAATSVHIPVLPSRLHLSKQNHYGNTQLDLDSKAFLQARFGKYTCGGSQAAGYFPNLTPSGQSIDWNGDGVLDEELYLEGEQCLVFHLGGVPLTVNGITTMIGFSSNKANPAQVPTTGEHRDGPFFEFQSNRLRPRQSAIPGNSANATFPEYLDPYQQTGGVARRQPFAFFASYILEGGGQYNKYGPSDCPSLPVLPYIQASPPSSPITLFVNPSNFQIISAGRDGAFGPGGTNWNPKIGTAVPAGTDDQSNFSSHLLGIAP